MNTVPANISSTLNTKQYYFPKTALYVTLRVNWIRPSKGWFSFVLWYLLQNTTRTWSIQKLILLKPVLHKKV
jgi:hypothetical protein